MVQKQLEHPQLTLDEVGQLLNRYVENVAVARSSTMLCNAASPIPAS
jgi:hypothetical protein